MFVGAIHKLQNKL
jgi:hypothetical protein